MRRLTILLSMAILCSCGGRNSSTQVPNPVGPHEQTGSGQAAIDTVKSNGSIVGTGKVHASRYADLSFSSSLPIVAVPVHDGQRVKAGQVLARLDGDLLRLEVEKAKKRVESTNLRKMDVVVSQGYDPEKLSEVPAGVISLAETKSEYGLAQLQLQEAEKQLTKTTLTAPFSGVIANLDMNVGAVSSPGKAVCRVIDDSSMQVEFSIMEHELSRIKVGTKVNASPFALPDNVYPGVVTEINPMVNAHGNITVRAEIEGRDGLYDGMNVNIEVCR